LVDEKAVKTEREKVELMDIAVVGMMV